MSGSGPPSGAAEGEVMNHGGEGVDPIGDIVTPDASVGVDVDPVMSSSRRLCTRVHPPTEWLGYRMVYIFGITTSCITRIVRYKISTSTSTSIVIAIWAQMICLIRG